MYRSSKLLRINESCKYGKSVKYPMGLWESADVDVLPGRRCFAAESSPA